MVGFFDFFTKREKTVKHKTIKSEISNLSEKLMDGIIDLSETANKMKKLKEQLKDIPDDDSDSGSGSDSDNTDKTASPNINQGENMNSVTTAPLASPTSPTSPSASPTPNNVDKGFLANFNIFGNKKAEPAAEPEKQNPEPEKKQEVSSVSSESPLPRPDAVMPNKDLAMAPAQVNPNNYTEYLANGGPSPEYDKNIRGGKDKKKHKKTKHAKRSTSGKRTKKQKNNTASKEEPAQTQTQTQSQTQEQSQTQA